MNPRQKRLYLAKFFRHRTSLGNFSDIGGRRTLRSFSEEGHKASADSTEYLKPIRADKYLRSYAYINYHKIRTRVQKRDAFIILGASFLLLAIVAMVFNFIVLTGGKEKTAGRIENSTTAESYLS